MTDNNAFERFVAEHLADDGSGAVCAERLAARIHERTGERRQWPRWLALIKEPPMRTNNHLAVGSPTVRVAAVMLATILLALTLAAAGAGVQRLLAAEGPIIVAQDGSGTYETVAEAIAAAADGDTILVRPGTYAEALIVDKDVVLRGDGPIEEIVIAAAPDGPTYETGFSWNRQEEYALVLVESGAEVSGLTFSGENARLFVHGGAPTLRSLAFDDVGRPYEGGPSVQAIVIRGGSTAHVLDSSFVDGGGINIFEESSPLIEGNELDSGPGIYGDYGDGTIIVGNHIFGPGLQGIDMGSAAAATIRDNTVTDKADGMWISGSALVEGNIVRNSGSSGIAVPSTVSELGAPTIRANELSDNRTGIRWENGEGVVEGNVIVGGTHGILLSLGSPQIRDNTVEGAEDRGIYIGPLSSAVLSGNVSCGNGTNLVLMDGATPKDDGTNKICEDDSAD